MKKTKCIKSIIGIGTIGAIGLGISAGITSCGKATDVVSFDSAYKPSVSTGDGEQTYHASSSMAGKISYKADNLPSEATFDNSSGKLNYTSAVPTNQDITINATSDKGGHSSIKITLLADTPVPPTPTPALSASILNNNLQLGTNNTATLSVTEINATEWINPDLIFDNNSLQTNFTNDSWVETANSLTKTTTISISFDSPTVGLHTITILLDGYESITQTFTVLPVTPTPTLSATISANTLQLDKPSTSATLSVTEINTSEWTDPTISFGDASGKFIPSESWEGNGLTRTKTISINSSTPPTDGPHTITILASGYDSITQTFTVLPATITLVISPTTLANNTDLALACNLDINSSGELNRKTYWDTTTNTAFANYLANLHITTIRFEGVSSIGEFALSSCTAITSVDFSNCSSLTSFGSNTISDCTNLTSIALPSSLTTIGNNFLINCRNLTTVDLSHLTNLSSIGDSFLYYNGDSLLSLTSIDLSSCTALTTIGNSFLSGCNSITNISFPSSLTSIGSNFLSFSALTSLDLSSLTNLTSIGNEFLRGCSALTSVTVGANDFSRSTISLGTLPMYNVTNIATNTIHGAKALQFQQKIGSNISNWTCVQ